MEAGHSAGVFREPDDAVIAGGGGNGIAVAVATKMSPFGPMATSHGWLKVSCPSPTTPALPRVIRTLLFWTELDHAVADTLASVAIGMPKFPLWVERGAAGEGEHATAPFGEQLTRFVELQGRARIGSPKISPGTKRLGQKEM